MAYKLRQICEIEYGQFGAYLKTVKAMTAVLRDHGRVTPRVMVATIGPNNEVAVEYEYPDLATLESESSAFYADENAFEAYRAGAAYVVQGTARTELLEDVPADFPGSA